MGARGPAPKPIELRLLEGNRGRRPIDTAALFRPDVGAPSMPLDMSPDAKKAWKRLVPELVQYNLLSTVDADALQELCETIGLIAVLRRSINARADELREKGEDPAEAIERSSTYRELNKERDRLRGWLAEFGLTPAQRVRVTPASRANLQGIAGGKPSDPAQAVGFADF